MMKKESEERLEELLVNFTDELTGRAVSSEKSISEKIDSLSEEKEEISSLFETARMLSSVIQPRQPCAAFVAKVSDAVHARFQDQISKEKIQKIIGMAVTVEEFRKSLFADIVGACRGIGLTLTPKEIVALRNLKEDAVNEFANSLDERITKFFTGNLP